MDEAGMERENLIAIAHQQCVSACQRLNYETSKPDLYTDALNSQVSYNLTIPSYKEDFRKYLLENNVIDHDSVSSQADFLFNYIAKCEATSTGATSDGLDNSLLIRQTERQGDINFFILHNDTQNLLEDTVIEEYEYALFESLIENGKGTINSLPSSGMDACKGIHSCQQDNPSSDLIQETESKNNVTQDADSSHSWVSRTMTEDSPHSIFNDTQRSNMYNIYKIVDINSSSETTTEPFNNDSVFSSAINDVTSTLVENKIFNAAIKDQSIEISCSSEHAKDLQLQNSDFITEAKDIYDPECEDIRKVNTDEARYKVVKECWKSSHPPDPQKNLIHTDRLKRTGNCLSGTNIAGKKRTATSNPPGIILAKCAKKEYFLRSCAKKGYFLRSCTRLSD